MSIFKLFLSLCIVLSGGGISQLTHFKQAHTCEAPRKVPKRLEMVGLGIVQNGPNLIIKPLTSTVRKCIQKIEAIENEINEKELVPSRKLVEIGNFYAFFDPQTLTSFPLYVNKSLPFFRHFSYNLSYGWHLACQVFRV